MRLVHIGENGQLSLVRFDDHKAPCYAILSHTWGQENEEISFKDMTDNSGQEKSGYIKLSFMINQARKDGLRYFWIDTCCINQDSSAELSEAITSMFRWYQESTHCYVYLSDVLIRKRKADHDEVDSSWELAFRDSRWFKRGWTLQELIAPRSVKFFSKEKEFLGSKATLEKQIHEITRVPIAALQKASLSQFSIEERLSWAKNRQTKRAEDKAYSLLGLIGTSMAAIYGEGEEKAFKRLLKEAEGAQNTIVTTLDQSQRQMLMESIFFAQIDSRHMTIKGAHAKTCRWLLKSPQYIDWINPASVPEHLGFLWIRGKPGAGKSTLMKFAFTHVRKKTTNSICIAYFFNARGDYLERSTIGAYRSLLFQLLERLPFLQSVFESFGLSTRNLSSEYQWSVEALKALLEQTFQRLGKSFVVCFIDALDECDEKEIRDMVSFFESVSVLAISNGTRLHICFSSRHYPNITMQKALSLDLEGQEGHAQDITNYLESELKIGKTKIAQEIRDDLQAKSSGVFMWVVLVTEILNQEYDHGRMHALKRRIKEIPADLHALFNDILTRDSRNKDELVLSIQWVLFAKSPLSPEQLYFAILIGVDPEVVGSWNAEEVTRDTIRRFLLDASKGLIEITKGKAPKVQFIHESVRDFLLKENGLGRIWPDLLDNFSGQSHDRLKRCCLSYINLDIETPLGLGETLYEASISNESHQHNAALTETFPFMQYAVQTVWYHADAAEGTGISQEGFIKEIQLSRWISIDNMFERHKIRKHTEGTRLLYIFGEYNLPNLVRSFQGSESCFEVGNERYGTPFFAALATESKDAVSAFVTMIDRKDGIYNHSKAYLDYSEDNDGCRIFGRDFTYPKRKKEVHSLPEIVKSNSLFELVLDVCNFDINTLYEHGMTLLMHAARKGFATLVKKILQQPAVDVHKSDFSGTPALLYAIQSGSVETVKCFLQHPSISFQDNMKMVSTDPASYKSRAMLEFLMEHPGFSIDYRNDIGMTSLMLALKHGTNEVIELVLSNTKVSVNAKDILGNTALMIGAYCESSQVEILLRSQDIDVNVKSPSGETTLMLYVMDSICSETIECLLRSHNILINEKDHSGKTALMIAARSGFLKIVDLILNYPGCSIGERDNTRGTAMLIAAKYGHWGVVERLMEVPGNDVNEKDASGNTVLIYATLFGHIPMVKLLLETPNIKVNEKNMSGSTALICAALRSDAATIEILLKITNISVNERNNFGHTALAIAKMRVSAAAVEHFKNGGPRVDVEFLDHSKNSALSYAVDLGREDAVRLLLRSEEIGDSIVDLKKLKASGWTPMYPNSKIEELLESYALEE